MPTPKLISPCLWFDGNAEAAINFYTSIFPQSRILQVFRWSHTDSSASAPVLTIHFELSGQPFMALNGGPQFKFTEAVSFMVYCDTQAEIDHYWSKLTADGGQEVQCGWLKDRFGLSWQIVPSIFFDLVNTPDRARVERVMRAMMQMVKMDLAALQAAARGQ